jgi:hypothetical protein
MNRARAGVAEGRGRRRAACRGPRHRLHRRAEGNHFQHGPVPALGGRFGGMRAGCASRGLRSWNSACAASQRCASGRAGLGYTGIAAAQGRRRGAVQGRALEHTTRGPCPSKRGSRASRALPCPTPRHRPCGQRWRTAGNRRCKLGTNAAARSRRPAAGSAPAQRARSRPWGVGQGWALEARARRIGRQRFLSVCSRAQP